MPIYHRTYRPGELQFITTSTYRRAPVFFSPRFCHYFVQRVEAGGSADHRLCGPRLFGRMFTEKNRGPQKRRSALPGLVVKELKEETAKRILKAAIQKLTGTRAMDSRFRGNDSVGGSRRE
jgi:hypothetical protein